MLKKIKVKFYNEECDYTLIETFDDVMDYLGIVHQNVGETVHNLLTKDLDVQNWDHLVYSMDKGGVLTAAVGVAKLRGTNPLFEIDGLVQTKLINMMKLINAGEKVIVNKNGGYCNLSPKLHTVLSISDHADEAEETVFIKNNTAYINLENDPVLEKRTIQYLSEKDPNFSYVLRLRDHDVSALTEIFKKFKINGGRVVYVYTTGIDINQMYEYSDAMIAAGIKEIELELNAGKTNEHDEVIAYLKKSMVNVTLISEEK